MVCQPLANPNPDIKDGNFQKNGAQNVFVWNHRSQQLKMDIFTRQLPKVGTAARLLRTWLFRHGQNRHIAHGRTRHTIQ